jgi:hypothetical protein
MFRMKEVPLGVAQSVELAQMLELEACWENLAKTPAPAEHGAAMRDLQHRQKAHQAFQTRLALYNKRYKTNHTASIFWSTPARLGTWCLAMRDLCFRIQHDAGAPSPVHMVEKAFRLADRIALRLKVAPPSRVTPPTDTVAAIRDLDLVSRWCADLVDGSVKDGFAELAREDPPAGAPHLPRVYPADAADGLPDVPADPGKADHLAVDLGPAVP